MRRLPPLTFAPLAWIKWQYLCHAGPTEVASFGLSSARDRFHLEDLLLVRQRASFAAVAFDDPAVADHFDQCVDAGLPPSRFARIWLHTHPGSSPFPSLVDEETFDRVFGGCDWAVMAILSRSSRTYARLRFGAVPEAQVMLPVAVDWHAWPADVNHGGLQHQFAAWRDEHLHLVEQAAEHARCDSGAVRQRAERLTIPDFPMEV